jgi:hypothetical protein
MAIVTDERPMATVPDEEVTDEECVDYARECVRLAALCSDQEVREQLLQMARNWMAEAARPSHPSGLKSQARQSKGRRRGAFEPPVSPELPNDQPGPAFSRRSYIEKA